MKRYSGGFRKLIAWQEAMNLVVGIYAVTKTFPKEEMFHLVNQIRRASTSVTANLAEGSAMSSQKHRNSYYERAKGSAVEVENFVEASFQLKYISKQQYEELIDHVSRVIYLIHKLITSVSVPSMVTDL